MRTAKRSVHVLLVEDNPGDVRLVQEGFAEGELDVRLTVVGDGDDALAYLTGGEELPDMVLLDLNLPRRSGREVLDMIKQSPELRRIPVCVLTSSGADLDIADAYDRHANSYVTKPMELDRFLEAVRRIERFWLDCVSLPTVEHYS